MSQLDRLDQITEFDPFYDEEATKRLLDAYYQVPHTFDDKLKSQLFDHATFYNIPLEQQQVQETLADKEFSLMEGVKQMGQGFLSGFSTFNVGEPSNNEYERIMRSVGELAGFVGYVPAAPFKAMKAYNLARAATQLRGNSVPMYVARKATEKAAPIVKNTLKEAAKAKNSAYSSAAEFLIKDNASHVAEGAFNLGVASSVGAWQLGVNEMIKSGLHGAATGGVFRGIANLVNKGGIPKLDPTTGRTVYTAAQNEDRLLRAAASSLYDGLQSTYRGETTPEQIYSYLLGAYFGSHETTAGQMRAMSYVGKVEKQAQTDAKSLKRLDKKGKPYWWDAEIYDPQRVEGFSKEPRDIQESVYQHITARHGTFSSQARTVDATLEQLKDNYEVDIDANLRTDRIYNEQIAERQSTYEGSLEAVKKVTPRVVDNNPEKIFLVDDNTSRGVKGRENVVEIPGGLYDDNIGANRKIISDLFKEVESGKTLVIPDAESKFGEKLKEEAPQTFLYLMDRIGSYTSGRLGAKKEAQDAGQILPDLDKTGNYDHEMTEPTLRKKARAFVNTYLKDITDGLSVEMAGKKKMDAEAAVYELLEKHPHLDQFDDFIKNANVKFRELGQASLNEQSERELRNIFVRKTQQKEVKHFTFYMGKLTNLDSSVDINVQNRAGDSKLQAESPKIIDKIYLELTGRADAIRKWDHIVVNEDGVARTVDIKDIHKKETHKWANDDPDNPLTAKRAKIIGDSFISNAMKQAHDQGYYYSGGKGDSGSMYFYKYHPDMVKMDSKEVNSTAKRIAEIFNETTKDASNHYTELRNKFINETNNKIGNAAEKGEYFDRAFISNIMYDKSAYGIGDNVLRSYSSKGKKGTVADGFFKWIRDYSAIQNAKGFNKRNQIWLTDGFDLDVNFFNKQYKKRGGVGTEDGKAKYRIFKDIDTKKLSKDDRAALYAEATDGAILVEENFINALNAAYGLPKSGQNKSFIVDNDPTHGALLGKFMFHKASKKASEWMRKEGLHMLMPESAVKETGSRIVGDLAVDKSGKGEYTRGTTLPDIKVVKTKKEIVSSDGLRTVGAQTNYKKGTMLINESRIKEDFKNKAWLKPKLKGVHPLPEGVIKTPQDLIDFYITHEKAHFTPENIAIKDRVEKENHANQLALRELGTQKYELNLEGIKGSLSEKQTSHMMDRQMIPKQLMANLVHHSKSRLNRDIIDDYFDVIIKEHYNGDAVENQKLSDMLDLSKKEFNEVKQEEILKNFNKYGLREVIDALRNKKHYDFVSKLYQKVLKSNTQAMHQDYESGEISQNEYLDLIAEAKHYTSNINRMMQIYPDVAVFMHKDVRNYLQAALRNFVVNQVTRPKWDYSISTRMRGLDPWLAQEFDFMNLNTSGKGARANKKRLKEEYGVENADELFMLDNKYRDVEYVMPKDVLPAKERGGKYSLGELWDNYMATPADRVKTNRDNPELVEWFRTVSLRVPMDSISGAHKLTFAGFTGIDGHGAVFHPRTMKALGGADLDGDKAFVLFGMKKEHKDLYHSNKYEYFEGDVKSEVWKGKWDNKSVKANPDKYFIFGDNEYGVGLGGQAVIRNQPNAFGIPTKKKPGMSKTDFWSDKDLAKNKKLIDAAIERIPTDKPLVFAEDGLGTGRAMLHNKAPKTFSYLVDKIKELKTKKGGIADNKGALVSPEGMEIIREALGKSQRDDFIRSAIDKKSLTYRDLLTTTTEGSAAELALKNSPIGKYTVQSRMDISTGASEGRSQLGPAVTQKQILNSAYDAMINIPVQRYNKGKKTITPLEWAALSDKQKEGYEADYREKAKISILDFESGLSGDYEIFISPRTSEGSLNYSRELMRAQIGFGSDPLDEIALTGSTDWFNKAWHSMFKVDWNGNEGIKKDFSPNIHARQGLVKTFTGFNQAYFSRNWKQNRRWYAHEILERAREVDNLLPEQKNTMLPKMVELIRPITYSDDLLRRVDIKDLNLEKKYENYARNEEIALFKLNKELGGDKKGGLFDRFTFRVKYNKEIKRAISLRLDDPERRLHFTEAKNFGQLFDKDTKAHIAIRKKGLPLNHIEKDKYSIDELLTMEKEANVYRGEKVDEFYRDHSFFLQSDLMDFTSGKQILKAYEIAKSEGIKPQLFQNMVNFVESVKNFERANLKKKVIHAVIHKMPKVVWGKDGKPTLDKVVDIEKTDQQFATQEKVDKRIRDFKLDNAYVKKVLKRGRVSKVTGKREYALTDAESYLFDSLMLSSYYKGRNIEKLAPYKAAIKAYPGLEKALRPMIKEIYKGGSGTYWHKTAIKTKYTSDQAIKDFLEEYSGNFRELATGEYKVLKGEEYIKDIPGEGKSKEHAKINIYEDPLDGIANIKARIDENPDKHLTKAESYQVNRLAGHLNYYHNSIGTLENLNLIARGLRRKNFDAFTMEDFRVMNDYFDDLRGGTAFLKDGSLTKRGVVKLSQRHWMLFPKTVSREMMVKDFTIFEQDGRFQNYNGELVAGKVGEPTHIIENIQYILGNIQDFATKLDQDEKTLFDDMLRDRTGYESLPDGIGQYFSEIATARRDLRAIRSKGRGTMSNSQYQVARKTYMDNLQEAKDAIQWSKVKDKEYSVTIGDDVVSKTGKEIVKDIDNVLFDVAIQKFKWIRGSNWDWDPTVQDYVINPDKKDPIEKYIQVKRVKGKKKLQYWNDNPLAPKIDMAKFTKEYMTMLKEGKSFDMGFGMDNLRKVTNSFNIEHLQSMRRKAPKDIKADYDQTISALSNNQTDFTNYFNPNAYHPHFISNKKVAKDAVLSAIEGINKNKSGGEERVRQLKQLIHQYKNMTGEWLAQDLIDNEIYDQAMTEIQLGKKGEAFKQLMTKGTTGNMMSRSTELPGWDRSLGSWDIYNKNLIDTFHRQIGNILSRDVLNKFSEKVGQDVQNGGWGDSKQTRAWTEYVKDYIQRAQGFSSKIPEHWTKGPEADLMKVKGTPYSWFADNHVKDMVNRIRTKLGFKDDVRLPEELRGIDESDIRHWSNLEAKYQMATLLAHPKSAVANIFGGNLHTLQSVGWRNFKNARNINYLKNIPGMTKWQTIKDVDRWVIGHGVVPDFILHEAGLNPNFKGGKWKAFLNDAKRLIDKDPAVKDDTLITLAKKHKITETAFQRAAWFMREPERALRRNSFVAHYLQARELYGHSDMPLDHPLLIEMAKKGVKATQFLYSAPYRPAFSATSLGKVMTRFQTWAWNSVRFRNDTYKQAKIHGFRKGTPEFERFKRQYTTDMFALALSNVFAYSLFESALPAPMNWFQDTADWVFGDEKERDRAFFGQWPTAVAPLQMVTPPGLRLVPATFSSIVNNDYSRLTDYYIWTMFPFGRIARDMTGIVENPMRTIEKTTGVPYQAFAREATKYRVEDDDEDEL